MGVCHLCPITPLPCPSAHPPRSSTPALKPSLEDVPGGKTGNALTSTTLKLFTPKVLALEFITTMASLARPHLVRRASVPDHNTLLLGILLDLSVCGDSHRARIVSS